MNIDGISTRDWLCHIQINFFSWSLAESNCQILHILVIIYRLRIVDGLKSIHTIWTRCKHRQRARGQKLNTSLVHILFRLGSDRPI
jgi:hypothetical protein